MRKEKKIMTELENARNEIMKDFISQRIDITKPLLLSCIAKHERYRQMRRMSSKNTKLLNNAICLIWNETFGTDVSSCDIISNM